MRSALQYAQQYCFGVGLTTVDDAGLTKPVIDLIQQMHAEGALKMRVYAMLTDNQENLDYWLKAGPLKTERPQCPFV